MICTRTFDANTLRLRGYNGLASKLDKFQLVHCRCKSQHDYATTNGTFIHAVALATLLSSDPFCFSAAAAQQFSPIQGPARVVDGDTLVINEERIRLYGVDAPEKAQSCKTSKGAEYSCGQRSKEALTTKIGSKQVTCLVKNKDQYGRNVAVCTLRGGLLGGEGEELNEWLVSNGFAVAYRQYGKEYIPVEEKAKAEHRGLWDGSFTTPSDWRKQQKAAVALSSGPAALNASALGLIGTKSNQNEGGSVMPMTALQGPTCPSGDLAIKGNIGSKGDKIYHVPGSGQYNLVKIEEQDGEKYFCSESEAQAAGWRRSNTAK
ncbi:hypothetical protein CEUSTIGMA_g11188.t1 [Chlamydomonas eustigma]|uniref:TNase-like domain-containing protein n=1 Tax=Chlamydomonas eustigma TaxID=1157962 RepID=A0A250XL61_9CHLO|nr:hypothetical protein CEUSTIGMA_g11188.t1 [Chlamydomonas eustigma]|eukprot:GAX83763.1 hypothetical protein CEUSTIGMA_g11188.t1 [Chlamydomonas eustigma]